jgi:His-Xaa-Ser system radical SAM maturase HxsC
MLKLGGPGVETRNFPSDAGRLIVRLSESADRPSALRPSEAFLARGGSLPGGFGIYLACRSNSQALEQLPSARAAVLPDDYDYLADGDIIRLIPGRGEVRSIYRRNSEHNSFLTTERCNHYCLMCSQPPRDIDDSWIVDEIVDAIPLVDPRTRLLGLTGGEPTLLRDGLLRILRVARSYLPQTAVHLLSNGRSFEDADFARRYAEVRHPNLTVGIPLYSDVSTLHDHVVQADGAFDETIRGILNLRRERQRVEIRVVLHRKTTSRLPQLAEFIARNLTFVDHVALMGLEITGFTRANLDQLWIDPADYKHELYEAATILASAGMNVSIYNHQLCLLDQRLWPLSRKSISDWKNEFMPECEGCTKRSECGGFFSSGRLRYSDHITPFAGEA